jgi:integrase
VKDARKVFHSFRHSFKNSCRAAHVTEDVRDRLTGHAGSGVGRSYGSGVDYPLEPLAKAVKRLRFDDFPL